MGCDIHAHIEVKINGKWEHYSCPPLQRSYRLFEKICGVRGNVENAIAPPRGLPSELNIVTQIHVNIWESDGHSYTFLTREELVEFVNWVEDQGHSQFQHEEMGYLYGNNFDSKVPEIEDVRFICWFDN